MNEDVVAQKTELSEREARAAELLQTFSYDGYQVVRKELFAHQRDPAMVVRKDSITFNNACINGIEGAVYVLVMFNEELKRLVVQPCDENNKYALRWCISKSGKRSSRKMTCKPLAELIYSKMQWDKGCRYKMLGYLLNYKGQSLYVFDLLVSEIFQEGIKSKKADGTAPKRSSKGYYPEDIVGTFGVPVPEYHREHDVVEMNGYVSLEALTGESTAAKGAENRKQ